MPLRVSGQSHEFKHYTMCVPCRKYLSCNRTYLQQIESILCVENFVFFFARLMSMVFCNIDLIILVNWIIDLIILALCNLDFIYFGPLKYWFDNFGLLQHWFVINTMVLGSVDEGIGGLLSKSRSPMSSWHFTRPWSTRRYLIDISVSLNFDSVVLFPENNIFFNYDFI